MFVFSVYAGAFVLSASELMKCWSYYIITCNCYCLRHNPFFILVEYLFYIFFRANFQKTVKIPIDFMFLWRIYTRVSAISLTWDITLINKPHVVNNFFAFLKAADEHCYDAFFRRYKVKPWVWKSNHELHCFASENQTYTGTVILALSL